MRLGSDGWTDGRDRWVGQVRGTDGEQKGRLGGQVRGTDGGGGDRWLEEVGGGGARGQVYGMGGGHHL